MVLSTHDSDHALLCADRVALLPGGRLVALGAPEATITPETRRRPYGVEVAVVPLPVHGRSVCTPVLP